MADEKKFEKRKEKPMMESQPASEKATPMEQKIKSIVDSKMPESQKQEYLKSLNPEIDSGEGKMPFHIYARIRKIVPSMHKAYMVYPKAKAVKMATLEQWDEIFKEF
jgi:hypothetical protein